MLVSVLIVLEGRRNNQPDPPHVGIAQVSLSDGVKGLINISFWIHEVSIFSTHLYRATLAFVTSTSLPIQLRGFLAYQEDILDQSTLVAKDSSTTLFIGRAVAWQCKEGRSSYS